MSTNGSFPLQIDCATCPVRDVACDDCVVTALLGPADLAGDSVIAGAVAVLAERGLVPPLRDPRRSAG
ncbi:MAG: hypothetical protein U0R64_04930 [Candidatus Nanopelagicales bacterium]